MPTQLDPLHPRIHHPSSSTQSLSRFVFSRTTEEFDHDTITHLDRNSVIALGVLLIFILGAIAWYFHGKIKGSLVNIVLPTSQGHTDEVRQIAGGSHANLRNEVSRVFTMDRFKSKGTGQDSGSSMRQNKSIDGVKIHPCSSLTSSRSSSTTTRVCCTNSSHTLDACRCQNVKDQSKECSGNQPLSNPRAASLPYYAPSPPMNARSHHRRSSSIHSVPDSTLTDIQSYQPTPFLTQPHRERPWWTDIAHRGSSTHINRHVSVLEPILEPNSMAEIPCTEQKTQGGGYDWTRPEAMACEGASNGIIKGGQFKEVKWGTEGEEEAMIISRLQISMLTVWGEWIGQKKSKSV
ncbi:hypothetical protein GQ44DRAFT_824686 [Phaeosphaeriaceae sp. PMI808]|nr:hypothetical protein GQ44DRAFT_824686 [Phaeosphaeriaceae sp. PMI808]